MPDTASPRATDKGRCGRERSARAGPAVRGPSAADDAGERRTEARQRAYRHTLHGMAGSGRTAVGRELAHLRQGGFDTVVW
jgi:hypothetical protein